MAQASKHRAAAEAVQQSYTAKKAAITANTDLSAEGRQRQLADAYASAKRDLAKHAAAERSEMETRWATLERDLFGARKRLGQDEGSYAISARDASDRAAKLQSPAEALDLLQRAEVEGDDILARAVARVSQAKSNTGLRRHDEQWEGVLRAYIDNRPHLEPIVEELAEVETASQPQIFGPFSITAPPDVPTHILNAAALSTSAERDWNASMPAGA